MYQYYNTEPKDRVFADLKKNIKISKDKIPAATQLFTPDWIVRYMVENSLGRLWVEGHPNETLKQGWKYYLEEAEQEPEVQARLDEIRKGYAALRPEEIKAVDPCMGSGHILVYLFDVLMQIYESQGWTRREAAQSIVQNNLYGLDIDERAAQLAYFAVMMKARFYDRRFLGRGIEPHVYEIQESNGTSAEVLAYFANGNQKLKKDMETLMTDLRDAKEYGSILTVTPVDFPALYARFDEIREDISMYALPALNGLLPLVKLAEAMVQKYHVVVTNPPYMGSSNMNGTLLEYVKKHYPDSKSDLSTVCMEKTLQMCDSMGYMAMINIPVWMFLSSYEKLRLSILRNNTYINMVHPGRGIFGSDFGTTSFVIAKYHIAGYKGHYRRLFDVQGEVKSIEERELAFLSGKGDYTAYQDNFSKIPGAPVAYWVKKPVYTVYAFSPKVGEHMLCKSGIMTGDEKYIVLWHEVDTHHIKFGCRSASDMGNFKWFPLNSGGDYRLYYGNNSKVVNLWNDGYDIKHNVKNYRLRDKEYYFKNGITWGRISSSSIAFREVAEGSLFGDAGPIGFIENNRRYMLGFLCSKVALYLLVATNPTLNYQVRDVENLPFVMDDTQSDIVTGLVKDCIVLSHRDWDSFETSWDFKEHPLIRWARGLCDAEAVGAAMMHYYGSRPKVRCPLELCYMLWQGECSERFQTLKANEEELNRIFIDIYGLQDELTPDVEDKDVTVRRADLGRDIRSLISYAVGCMFGRYALDVGGLAYAGGAWDSGKYKTFLPDPDNCIPITDEPYFEDDIVGRFVEFIRTVYGADTLEENLSFIAKALSNKGSSSREVIRNYFLNDFMKDHIKVYQKRPIYWLFDSGKQNGFKALVYMHRWNADTVGNLRVEYLHRMQRVYEKEIERMQDIIDNGTNSREISQATKRREKLVKQLKEARDYDARIAHAALSRVEIDLDDGVKVNYEKVQKGPDGKSLGILAKI